MKWFARIRRLIGAMNLIGPTPVLALTGSFLLAVTARAADLLR